MPRVFRSAPPLVAVALQLFVVMRASAVLAQPPPPPASPPPAAAPAAPDPLAIALAPVRGGLTPDEAARAAARTRASVRTKQAELKAAQARVDQAIVGFFPKVSLIAQAEHVSFVDNTFPGAVLATATSGPISTGPCPGGTGGCVLDAKGKPVGAAPIAFPLIQNQYAVIGSISVPVSDYVLRLSQGYAAASHGEKSKRLETEAETLTASVDGRIAYFNWVHGRGQTVVAHESVEAAQGHVVDAKHAFEVGLVSRADVLRLEAQVASAEGVEAQALAFEEVAAEQLRVVMGTPPGQRLTIGIDVLHVGQAPPAEDLAVLNEQALQRRLEVRALDETVYSLKQVENVAAAGYLPRIDAFADGTYADPNQRFFLEKNRWDFTWDVGVRLSWTVNDTFTALGAVSEAKAKTQSVLEQRGQIRDALRIEVVNAWSEARRAWTTLDAADRGLAAAEESLRVRRELFRNGKATSVDLVDAEAEATRARLARLDARLGVAVSRVRLDHATGRDVR